MIPGAPGRKLARDAERRFLQISATESVLFHSSSPFYQDQSRTGERSFMKWPRVRMGLSILLILFACGVAAFEFNKHLGGAPSVDTRIRQLEKSWTGGRREAATTLG